MNAGRTAGRVGMLPTIPFMQQHSNGRGLIRVAGPVTLATLCALHRETFRCHATSEGYRVLIDFRATCFLLSDADWRTFFREWLGPRSPDLGVGFLSCAGANENEALRDFANASNMLGRITLAFSNASAAYRWLGLK